MLLFDHFFGAYKNIYLDYDYLHTVGGQDQLPVRFTRLNTFGEHDTAETIAPACTSWDVRGFTDEELDKLKTFLSDNMASLLAEAELARGGDAHLTTVTFELSESELLLVLRSSYLSGIAPSEFVREAIRDFIAAVEAGDIGIEALRKEAAELP